MKCSEQLDKLADALSKVQSAIKNPEKNKTATIRTKAGPSYSYNYADLPECFEVAKKAMGENGIACPCTVEQRDHGNFMVMRLIHSSGQWIESEWALTGSDEKTIAGSMTYGRRYLFCALLGIAAEDDRDDPNEEDKEKNTAPKESVKPKEVMSASVDMNDQVRKMELFRQIRILQKSLDITNDELDAEVSEKKIGFGRVNDFNLEQLNKTLDLLVHEKKMRDRKELE